MFILNFSFTKGWTLHNELLWLFPACLGGKENKSVASIFASLYFRASTTGAESLSQGSELRIALNLSLFVGKLHLNSFDLESH